MDHELLLDALDTLDVALIERLPNRMYFMLSRMPAWLEGVFDAAPPGEQGSLAGALPFLDHFLAQADAAWYEGGSARADSGPFAARVGRDELLLRAAAVTLQGRPILVLERLSGDADTRPILQKAREHLLDTERLTRQIAAVHNPASQVQRIVDELAAQDLPDVARDRLDRLRQASAALQSALAPLPTPPPRRRPS